METNFDVLIVGAGLSGIGMACQLKTQCPGKRVALLERRAAIGGTWDLFRYPGVRSDSDMFTFGYQFRPWNELKVLADGESIRRYVDETAREYGVDKDIRFGIKTTQASWSSEHKRWTISAIDESSGEAAPSLATTWSTAPATTTTTTAICRAFPASSASRGNASIRSIGRRSWTTAASASSSSAAARPR